MVFFSSLHCQFRFTYFFIFLVLFCCRTLCSFFSLGFILSITSAEYKRRIKTLVVGE